LNFVRISASRRSVVESFGSAMRGLPREIGVASIIFCQYGVDVSGASSGSCHSPFLVARLFGIGYFISGLYLSWLNQGRALIRPSGTLLPFAKKRTGEGDNNLALCLTHSPSPARSCVGEGADRRMRALGHTLKPQCHNIGTSEATSSSASAKLMILKYLGSFSTCRSPTPNIAQVDALLRPIKTNVPTTKATPT
jgi:hypothetical protein